MKVISPFYEILDHLDKQSMAIRIEACGRVCYKSEDKISAQSTEPFIKTILKHGHNSVMEMAVLTLKVTYDSESFAVQLFNTLPKYLIIDRTDKKELLISGSVRAFRELYQSNPSVKMIKAITGFLGERYPLFFSDLKPKAGWLQHEGIHIEKIPLDQVEKLSSDLLARHRHIAVKFTVNRAVTHEIVRHRPCSYLQESQRYCRYSEDKFDSQVTFIKPMFFEEGTEDYKKWEKAMIETEKIYLKLLKTSSPQAARTVLPNSCKTELITYANLIEWVHIFKLRTSRAAEPSMREVMIPLLDDFKKRFPTVFADLNVEN
ncbi:MAG: FAD-dependent thymidylate synthase [Proteobacteria bacterium]|nr:FAD-dependent thymidylate synthase [Pseudomonadota bacterium]MBU1708494.1 FAD-dependent thymidylate synthase [Pseudomonadota bacterium]